MDNGVSSSDGRIAQFKDLAGVITNGVQGV